MISLQLRNEMVFFQFIWNHLMQLTAGQELLFGIPLRAKFLHFVNGSI